MLSSSLFVIGALAACSGTVQSHLAQLNGPSLQAELVHVIFSGANFFFASVPVPIVYSASESA